MELFPHLADICFKACLELGEGGFELGDGGLELGDGILNLVTPVSETLVLIFQLQSRVETNPAVDIIGNDGLGIRNPNVGNRATELSRRKAEGTSTLEGR